MLTRLTINSLYQCSDMKLDNQYRENFMSKSSAATARSMHANSAHTASIQPQTHTPITKQEGFLIDEGLMPRKKIVRQDRIPVPPKKLYMHTSDLKLEVINISNFGVAIICTETESTIVAKHFSTADIHNITLTFEDIEIQKTNVKMAREELHPESVFNEKVYAFEVIGDPISTDCVRALQAASEAKIATAETFNKQLEIPKDLRLTILEMKSFLTTLKENIMKIENQLPVDNADENSEYRQAVTQSMSDFLGVLIPKCYKEIPAMLENSDAKTREAAIAFGQAQLGPLIYGAPFAHRAYAKPRGYAGDYEMMNHLYRNEPVGRTLFDQCLHKYFIDEPAGQAVKNRGYYLLEKIKELVAKSDKKLIRILAVASGPAMEQQLFLKESKAFPSKDIEFTCIDQDEESLKHAQRQLFSIERFVRSGYSFNFTNLAIKNIIARGLPEKGYDLIYTAGLFDYFSDPVAQVAGQRLAEGLAPDGSLIIGNFSKNNPSQPFMEMVLEWHLLYRSPEDMMRIFKGIGSSVEIEQEKLGINLFAVIKK